MYMPGHSVVWYMTMMGAVDVFMAFSSLQLISSFLLLFPLAASALPLCTDLRAPVTPKKPLSFCSYNGSSCCNATDDLNLEKQFSSMNVSDDSCASLLKSVLCARCYPFSANLFTVESELRSVPILCDAAQSKDTSKGFCQQIWDSCKDMPIKSSPFAPSLQGSASVPTTSYSKLTDLWRSEKDFCRAFGASSGNESVCYNGDSVLTNGSGIPPSPKGLCLERLWNGSYLNLVPHPDGSNRVFLANQDGKIWLATVPEQGSGEMLGLVESDPFLDLTDAVHRDTAFGMMGLAFHPQFASNGRLFASFNCDKTQQSNCAGRCACNSEVGCDPSKLNSSNKAQPCQYQAAIAEFTANGSSAKTSASASEVRRIFTMGLPYKSNHGGQILFGPTDGYLYFMMGDGGDGSEDDKPFNFAQNKKSVLGKIMRLDVDNMPSAKEIDDIGLWGNYSIPKDNPYIDDSELQPEVWALGLRNPWRCSFDSERPSYFFCADVGENTYEEVDLITKGGNYGWRFYEGPNIFEPQSSPGGNKSLSSIDAIPPIMGYKHAAQSASISGGYVYRSKTDPCMFGRYLFADLYATSLWIGTENPENSGNYTSTLTTFSCSKNSPIPCESVAESSLPSLGYIFSFGEDNNKDVYILASKGVYRVVRPSRCNYTCSIEHVVAGNVPPPSGTSSASRWSELLVEKLLLSITFFLSVGIVF